MAQESMVETMEPSSDQIAAIEPSVQPPSLSRSSSSSSSSSRLNAGAPEFVPRTTSSNHHHHHHHHQHRLAMQAAFPRATPLFHLPAAFQPPYSAGDLDPQPQPQSLEPDHINKNSSNANNAAALSDEVRHKILNQVEYYFSDVNLATTDHLIRFISKDPDGFVPISVVASFKKIKALVSSHHQLATVLRKSSKLVVSDDGKKVRRQFPLTETEMEDLQSRIVVAENLPEDHSFQNLMKVFSLVGSVKTIRSCQPQTSNSGASAASRSSKMENMLFCNKLHAFVEYETVEIAEKAVIELNDERNWRSGLRVRLLLKRGSKLAQPRGRKFGHEGEGNGEEDDLSTSELLNDLHLEDQSQTTEITSHDQLAVDCIEDKESGGRRVRGRGRGKGRGRGQHQNNRGSHVGTPPASNFVHNEQSSATKQPPGPRMPDGTKGFARGRGKPIV